jgi:hypothetical protein
MDFWKGMVCKLPLIMNVYIILVYLTDPIDNGTGAYFCRISLIRLLRLR